ncbi:Acid protease [Mycena sanguinolenta]|uniref:Acid protease n=1 Tax=Mycena sanguinolenta TaxID=230812 RepID=A0A8H6Y6S1_9AGAR|nr:Acid protease [Mycena sanguinolenta]
MQLSASFWALAAILLALSSANARPVRRNPTGLITFPLRLVERNQQHIPVELRHQQHLNRAERLVARVAGVEGPSDAQLRAKLERRASFLSSADKRFNIPPPGFAGSVSNVIVENETVENENTGDDSPPKLIAQSSAIDPDGPDTSFVFNVPIGTPSRDFNIILDSGSGDFWVESDTCTSQSGGGCGNHTFLGADTSSSFVNTKQPWSVTYGSGAASGELVTDTIVMGGMVLGNHTFGVAHSISESFSGDSVADGLMGLGKPGLSNQKVPTPVQSLVNAGFISAAITSYRLPRTLDNLNNGEVTFGGLDDSRFDSSTLVTLNATDDDFWITQLGGVTVNGATVSLSGARTALMDTGTTILVVPATDLDPIHAKIPGAVKKSDGSWTVPCNTTTSVALEFGGKSFPISSKDLPFASGGKTTGDCTSGIGGFSAGDSLTQWLVGGTFLKSVYFSTNLEENTITLAKAV